MYSQKLIDELRAQMKQAQEEAHKIKTNVQNNNFLFAQVGDHMGFNPRYLGAEDYLQIVELEKFLHHHPEVSNNDLLIILRGNVFYFGFLQRLHETIPNLSETLKALGAKAVAGIFVGTQLSHVCEYEL